MLIITNINFKEENEERKYVGPLVAFRIFFLPFDGEWSETPKSTNTIISLPIDRESSETPRYT